MSLSCLETEVPTQQRIEAGYQPQPKQNAFLKSFAKYRVYIGAWRAGKTYAGCQEALRLSMAWPNNLGLIGRKDFTDLRDTTMRTFFEVCPEGLIAGNNKTEHRVTLINGSEILFRELKDGAGLGSLNLGFFYVDESEEVEEQIFERLKGRLSLKTVGRQCGFLTSNPPNEDHWLFRQFELSKDPDFATFHASTYENKQYLPEGYIESLEKLPPSWRKKYLEGQYGFTPDGQPYYAGYIEAIHKRAVEWDKALPLYCGWDFGYRKPAFVVTQVDRQGRWKIICELMGGDTTIDRFVDAQVVPLLNYRFKEANLIHFGDPACHQVNDKSEFTSYQILQSKNFQLTCRQSEYRLRKELIEKKINTLIEGLPLLVVDPSCRIINDGFLGGYHYPTYKADQQYSDKHDQPFHDDFYSHCFSEETKFLTKSGWKYLDDISIDNDSIATLNKNGYLEYQKASNKVKYFHEGEVVEIKGRRIKLLATPGHRMLIKQGKETGLEFITADKLKRHHRIPIVNKWLGVNHKFVKIPVFRNDWTTKNQFGFEQKRKKIWNELKIDARLFYSFIGWYLSEGCCVHGKTKRLWRVCISQSKEKNPGNYLEIKSLLSRLPWNVIEEKNGFVVQSRQLWNYLERLGNSYTKRFPRELMDASSELLDIAWESYVKGDGHKNANGSIQIFSISEGLIEDWQEIALKRGKSIRIIRRKQKDCLLHERPYKSKDLFTGIEAKNKDIVLRDSKGNPLFSSKKYAGNVGCVTVPNGIICIKNDGVPIWSGNCMNAIEYIAINIFSPVVDNRKPSKPKPARSMDNI